MIAVVICAVMLIVAITLIFVILELRDDPWILYQPRHAASPRVAAAPDPVPLPVAAPLPMVQPDPDETASMPVVAARFLP